MNIKEWVLRNFDLIPTELIERAYRDLWEEIEILAPTFELFMEECEEGCGEKGEETCWDCYAENIPVIPMWRYVFVPRSYALKDFIEENANAVWKHTRFIVYKTDEIGVFLGVNGAGYDFYEKHWKPLRKLVEQDDTDRILPRTQTVY